MDKLVGLDLNNKRESRIVVILIIFLDEGYHANYEIWTLNFKPWAEFLQIPFQPLKILPHMYPIYQRMMGLYTKG